MSAQPNTANESTDYLQGLTAAAHELKTPLAIIAHLAAALEDEAFMDPHQRQTSLQRIQLAAERTIRLVQGLTASYRLDGQLVLQLQPININQLCEEVAHEITPFAAMQQQSIQLGLGHKQQLVVGERELLSSVLYNLLDNAIRHTPPATDIRMQLRRRIDIVRICVQDTGPGLRPSDITRLHQRLGRQLQPIVTRSSGSGLGLFIAQQLATAMGGSIGVGRVESGADFHVNLLHSTQLSLL